MWIQITEKKLTMTKIWTRKCYKLKKNTRNREVKTKFVMFAQYQVFCKVLDLEKYIFRRKGGTDQNNNVKKLDMQRRRQGK